MKLIIKLIVVLAIILAFLITIGHATAAEAPLVPLHEQSIENIVTYFALENDLNPQLALSVMDCESHATQAIKGDSGHAKGIYQYWNDTWERHSKEYGEKLDINSPYDQAKLATWAIAHGKGSEWSTFTAIQKGGTYSFYSKKLKKHFVVTCNLH